MPLRSTPSQASLARPCHERTLGCPSHIPYADLPVPYGSLTSPDLGWRGHGKERRHARRTDDRPHGGVLRGRVRVGRVAGARMSLADVLELILSVALLVYLTYALIRPERF